MKSLSLFALLVGVAACSASTQSEDDSTSGALADDARVVESTSKNPFGTATSFLKTGAIDRQSPFFQPIGKNGRACATCHVEEDGWTITPRTTQRLFEQTGGEAPVFRTVDGSNRPDADVSTVEARRSAYSMLLDKALIRLALPTPANAEFDIVAVDDPYGFASTAHPSYFRRPMPIANVAFVSAGGWDGRGPVGADGPGKTLGAIANAAAAAHQGATSSNGHPEAPLTDEQTASMVGFMQNLFFAQSSDAVAGALADGESPAKRLASERFFLGINDPLGGDPTGATFTTSVFTQYDRWSTATDANLDAAAKARASIARGARIFNEKPIHITGVVGLNDLPNLAAVDGHCSTCHDAPNVGNHSVAMALNIGISDESRRTSDLPLYTLKNKATGETVRSTDPGRALFTGKWKDIGKFKGPILRGVGARAPYFHNGAAASLKDVVSFYDARFGIGLTDTEAADLVAFLATL